MPGASPGQHQGTQIPPGHAEVTPGARSFQEQFPASPSSSAWGASNGMRGAGAPADLHFSRRSWPVSKIVLFQFDIQLLNNLQNKFNQFVRYWRIQT